MRMKMQSRKDIPILPDPKPVTRIDFGDHYPDGGWGWVVLGAATIVYILCHGFQFAFGTLFLKVIAPPFNTNESNAGKLRLHVVVVFIGNLFISCHS